MGQARLQAERVEIGFEMAAHAIGADQLQGPDRIRGRGAQRLDAVRACTGRCRFARHWGFRRRRGGAIGTAGRSRGGALPLAMISGRGGAQLAPLRSASAPAPSSPKEAK